MSDPARKPSETHDGWVERILREAQQEGAFEPDKFEDRYENALRDLIRRKEKGEKLVTAEPVEEDNVIDLMEALKASLGMAASDERKPAKPAEKPEAAAAEAAPKKKAASKKK